MVEIKKVFMKKYLLVINLILLFLALAASLIVGLFCWEVFMRARRKQLPPLTIKFHRQFLIPASTAFPAPPPLFIGRQISNPTPWLTMV